MFCRKTTCFSNPRLASGITGPRHTWATEAGREVFERQVCREVFGFEMIRAQSKRSWYLKSIVGPGT